MWHFSYRMFHAVSALSFWLERRLTRAGMLIAGAAILAGALGADTTLSMAYQAFAFLVALLAVSGLCLPVLRARVTVEREWPRVATAGEPFSYRARIINIGPAAVGGLSLIEELPDPRPTLQAFRTAVRFPTYRAWKRLVDASRMVQVAEQPVPALAPGGAAEVEVQAQALRRGVMHTRGLTVARADPLGLLKSLRAAGTQANLVVLPRRYPVPSFTLPGSRRYQQGGVSLATSVGDSEEFLSLRDYRPGDPLQRIHWKSFARAARPVVKEYQDEYFERHALVLDTFARGNGKRRGEERQFEEAVSIAASFACTIETRESLLDLMFIGNEAHSYTTGRGQLSAGASSKSSRACSPAATGRSRRSPRRCSPGARRCRAASACCSAGTTSARLSLRRCGRAGSRCASSP
jgi:uncharacterized protein (DUF58 family)